MDFEYFGDEWLRFHDYLNGMNLEDVIEAQINMNVPFIQPQEFAYYINSKNIMLDTLKCVRELKDEKDTTKHNDILKSWGKSPVDMSKPSYLS